MEYKEWNMEYNGIMKQWNMEYPIQGAAHFQVDKSY